MKSGRDVITINENKIKKKRGYEGKIKRKEVSGENEKCENKK